MKPAFALDLRDDAIGLLHRSGKTWQQVGGVSMDEPDLTGALSYLRASALGLSPRGVTTKLIIPNDQILYTTVSAPGPDDESRRTQIRAALEGRTPYAPEELVFDWSGSGDEVQVAVLARETLDEAEGFAAKHRFNPISFVAVPDEGSFEGEPWFGPTALSVSLLSGSEKVERDNLAVLDIRRNLEADIDAADHPMFDAVLVQPDTAEVSVTTEPEVANEPAEAAIVDPVADAAPVDLADAISPEPPVHDQIAIAEPQPVPAQTLSDVILPRATAVVEEAPMALDVAPDDDGLAKDISAESDAPPRPSVTDPGIKDDGGSASSLTTAMAFASRRTPDNAPKVARPPGVRPLAAEKPAAPRASVKPGVAKPESLDAATKPRKKNGIDTTVAPVLKPAIAPAAAPIAVPKASATTGLGSRAPAPVKRKTRSMGLILTAVLLLFLALVAAWSSIFLASDDTATPADPVQTSDMAPLPTEDEEMLADQQDPAEFQSETPAAATAEQTAEAPADAATTEPAVAEPQVAAPPPIAPSSAEAAPANAAQPSEQPQDEIVLATMDAPPATESPTSLPDPEARGDSLPTSQAAPPPFGTTYQFDANGLIKPTEQGIITPEGVTLYAGKPPLLPLARPAALAAAAPAPADATAQPAAETPAVAETPVDPALAKARPRARPANLGGTAAQNDAALTPAEPSMPVGQRPLARPAALAAAVAQPTTAADASIANLDTPYLDGPTSPLAIAISRRPAARPASMNRAVEAAIAEAIQPQARPAAEPLAQPDPQPEPELASAAPSADSKLPEAQDEPEAASAAPSIPTRASVAKQATLKNAIDLGKTNLIGVYGTPAKRYALVRTSTGGFKKVRKGDRVDGGKVVAITENELRYQKGSRTMVLALPKT